MEDKAPEPKDDEPKPKLIPLGEALKKGIDPTKLKLRTGVTDDG